MESRIVRSLARPEAALADTFSIGTDQIESAWQGESRWLAPTSVRTVASGLYLARDAQPLDAPRAKTAKESGRHLQFEEPTDVTSWRDRTRLLLATSLGPGLLPGGPGTWGTLPAVAAYVVLATFASADLLVVVLSALLLATCVLSVALGPWAADYWQGKDPGRFTVDELAGYFLTVVAFHAPLGASSSAALLHDPTTVGLTALWSFVAFRVFDIAKPPPVHYLERLPDGWGILADDLGAGIYAALALHALRAVLPMAFGL